MKRWLQMFGGVCLTLACLLHSGTGSDSRGSADSSRPGAYLQWLLEGSGQRQEESAPLPAAEVGGD